MSSKDAHLAHYAAANADVAAVGPLLTTVARARVAIRDHEHIRDSHAWAARRGETELEAVLLAVREMSALAAGVGSFGTASREPHDLTRLGRVGAIHRAARLVQAFKDATYADVYELGV